jgi:hypothetical protein
MRLCHFIFLVVGALILKNNCVKGIDLNLFASFGIKISYLFLQELLDQVMTLLWQNYPGKY